MEESSPFFPSTSCSGLYVAQQALYQKKVKRVKMALMVVFGLLSFVIIVTIIMTSVQAYRVTPLYVLLLINVLAVAKIPFFMVYFIHTERLSQTCLWAVFIISVCVIIEAINTDIIVFTIHTPSSK